MTVLQEIRDAVMDALNAAGAPCTFSKRRWTRDQELAAGEMRGAVLFHSETPSRAGGPGSVIVKRDHAIAVQLVTAVADPGEIDDALEIARAWMVAQLGGNTLGGLAHELIEGQTTWETAQLERFHGAFITSWNAQHQTRRDNLGLQH